MIPTVSFANGTQVPALGQGTWTIGDSPTREAAEIATLQTGIDLGMTLIDTAEMYGDGKSERLVGKAIAGQRDRVFLVSKIYPHNASASGVARACAASLKRLGTDRLDLYLLHWAGTHPLAETIEAFERLRAAGDIAAWGVSNFDTADMKAMAALQSGKHCATNQVLYHPDERGIEYDLIPWCRDHAMPIMAYSPLGQAGALLRSPALAKVAQRHNATPGQIALAWSLRDGTTIAIPKAASVAHVRDNAAATTIRLTPDDLAEIDATHPAPRHKQRLGML